MDEIDELDPKEVIKNIIVDAVDGHDKKLVLIPREFEEELDKKRKHWKKMLDDYDKGRLDSDDGIGTPIIPDTPKPPLNLGGYKKLEDEN